MANTIEFHPEIHGTAFPQRPSCRIRPVSGGRGRRYPSPRRRRPQPAAPRPPPGGPPKPPRPAARRLGPGGRRWRWRRDASSHMSCFGGFRTISGLKNGSLVMFGPPFQIETCITAHRNQDQLIGKSHLCRAIHCKLDQRFTITHCNLSKKSLESICIHLPQ